MIQLDQYGFSYPVSGSHNNANTMALYFMGNIQYNKPNTPQIASVVDLFEDCSLVYVIYLQMQA